MHPYRKLSVWRKAHALTVLVYRATQRFDRDHGPIAVQLRRAAHSIPSNIAEGSGRVANPQFAHHLQVSIASARELDYFLLLATDLGQISSKDHAILEARVDQVTAMLVALRQTVVARAVAGRTRRDHGKTG